MSHYETLGVDKSASVEEIKAAFKKLAMKHHPDRGGDAKKFQEINEAYTVLSDPEQRMVYDHTGGRPFGGGNPFGGGGNPFQNFSFTFGGDGFQQGFQQNFGPGHDPHFEEMMKNFGFGFARGPQKNRDLNLRYKITLRDAYTGKNVRVDYRLPTGEEQSVNVDIPPGIEHGQMIKLSGYGDNAQRSLPRGDLVIVFEVEPMSRFRRDELTLITETEISIFEAMIGCKKIIKNIDDTDVEIAILPGTRHGQKYSCRGLGFTSVKFGNVKGDLHVIVNVITPRVTDPALINAVRDLENKLR